MGLTILEDVGIIKHKRKVKCKCDCGNVVIKTLVDVKNKRVTSCESCSKEARRSKKINQIINTVVNNCTITDGYYLIKSNNKRRLFVSANCNKCGNNFSIRYDTLKNLHGEHCPYCNIKAKGEHRKKPYRDHKLWRVWWSMKKRCYDNNNKHYNDYGGRDIKVCDEWLQSYENFYNWSMNNGYGDGLSIDRIDTNKNYEPNNCRWTDTKTQAYNTRRNFFLWYNEKWRTVEEIAKIEHISCDKAYYKYITRKNTKLPRKQLYNIDNIKK